MKIRYLGPMDRVYVVPYGPHYRDEIRNYPDSFARELLATSTKQHFEAVDEPERNVKAEGARPESKAAPKKPKKARKKP
jgi:hypothetical protein